MKFRSCPDTRRWKNTYTWRLPSGFVDLELLQQFLVTRSDTVHSCQLEGCFNLTTEDVDELWEVVGDVVCWDDVELGEDDYEEY